MQPVCLTGGIEHKSHSVSALADGLFPQNAKQQFAENLEQIYDCWVPMLQNSTRPPDVPSTDNRVELALKALDKYIADSQHTSRLGSVQLVRFLSSLQKSIQHDRRSGRAISKKRNRSVVIDMYVKSRGKRDKTSRRRALQSVRMAKRWKYLAVNYPLHIIFLSNKAERIVLV